MMNLNLSQDYPRPPLDEDLELPLDEEERPELLDELELDLTLPELLEEPEERRTVPELLEEDDLLIVPDLLEPLDDEGLDILPLVDELVPGLTILVRVLVEPGLTYRVFDLTLVLSLPARTLRDNRLDLFILFIAVPLLTELFLEVTLERRLITSFVDLPRLATDLLFK